MHLIQVYRRPFYYWFETTSLRNSAAASVIGSKKVDCYWNALAHFDHLVWQGRHERHSIALICAPVFAWFPARARSGFLLTSCCRLVGFSGYKRCSARSF